MFVCVCRQLLSPGVCMYPWEKMCLCMFIWGKNVCVCGSHTNGRLVSIRCVNSTRGFQLHGAELALLRLARRRIIQVNHSSIANIHSEGWAFSFLRDVCPPLGALVVLGEFAPGQPNRLTLSRWFENPSLDATDRQGDVPGAPLAWAFEVFPLFPN